MRRVIAVAAVVAASVASAALAHDAGALPPGLGGDTQPQGNIRIIQDTGPDDPQVFTFDQTGSTQNIPSSFSLTDNNGDDAIGEFDTSVDFTGIPAGFEISITQRAVAGWPLTDLNCTLEDPQGGFAGSYDFDLSARNITVTIFDDYTWECRFRNDDRHGSITFIEDTVPNDTQPFAFTGDLGSGPTSFDGIPSTNVFFLDGDGDSETFSNLAAGTYTVTQSTFNTGADSGPNPSSGWDSTAISCNTGESVSLATRTITITLAELENVVCTFTNTQRPSVTIIQDSIVSTGQDFAFSGTLGSFSLDDDGNATLPGSKTFTDVTAGAITISEAMPSGWLNSSISCNGGSPVVTGTSVTFTVAAAQRITCTFTSGRPGSITISKYLDGFEIEDPQDFAFTTTGTGLNDFVLDVDTGSATPQTKTFTSLSPGTYTATEAAIPGWKVVTTPFSSGGDCGFDATQRKLSINLALEQQAQCYVTNTDRGSISMTSFPATSPDDPGSDIFQVDATGQGVSDTSFRIDAGASFNSLRPGVYSFVFDEPAGWTITSITCSGVDSYDRPTRTLTITLAALEDMSCSIVSSAQGGSITIVANSYPDPDPLPATSFGAFGVIQGGQTSPGVSGFTLDSDSATSTPDSVTFSNLPGGDYTFTENVPAGWRLGSISCFGEQTDLANHFTRITLEPNEDQTCYFQNTQTAALHIVNDTSPDTSEDWDLTIDDGNGNVFDTTIDGLPSGVHGFDYANPGTYTITLGTKSGWNLTGLSCSTGESGNLTTRSVSVTLSATEETTCTFTNVRPASITVVEESAPDDAQYFAYSGTLGAFSLDDDSDGALPKATTFTGLTPGTFTVTQGAVNGWETALSCTGSEVVDQSTRTATVVLSAGEQVTCTFTNTGRGSISVVQDSRPDGAQDFSYSTTIGAFPLDDDTDGTLGATGTLTGLAAGSYVVAQEPVAGWDLTDLTCTRTGGAPNDTVSLANRSASITLDPGEHMTCTFQNTQRGRVTIVQRSSPKSSDPFLFTGDLGAFSLRDDTVAGTPDTATFDDVVPGAYDLAQRVPSGWWLDDISCVRVGGTANDLASVPTSSVALQLDPGEAVTCTFSTVAFATITVSVDASPDDATDFSFTGDLGAFSLDDDSNGTLDGTQAFGTLVAGTYSIESVPTPGWTLTGLGCTGASTSAARSVSVTLAAGDHVTCSFASSRDAVPAPSDGGTPSGGNDPNGDGGAASTTVDIDASGTSASTGGGTTLTDPWVTASTSGDTTASDEDEGADQQESAAGPLDDGSSDGDGTSPWWLALLGFAPALVWWLRRLHGG